MGSLESLLKVEAMSILKTGFVLDHAGSYSAKPRFLPKTAANNVLFIGKAPRFPQKTGKQHGVSNCVWSIAPF